MIKIMIANILEHEFGVPKTHYELKDAENGSPFVFVKIVFGTYGCDPVIKNVLIRKTLCKDALRRVLKSSIDDAAKDYIVQSGLSLEEHGYDAR